MKSEWNDTIVALATPPGMGALGIIRLSGNEAIRIISQLFPSKNLEVEKSHTIHIGYLKSNEKTIDEVVISLFKSPRSYTGEDVVEISAHGSPFIHQQIIDVCVEKGARLAKPGEFTQRAFLNGKLDLVQAEAVADLIASASDAAHRTALHAMRGGFSSQLKDLREELIKFSALIELELDFSQEDVEFADRKQFYSIIEHAQRVASKLADSFKLGNVIRKGVSVAIIGKPNAGKSTLLNALLEEERAIVSEIPGTTRDTIEEVINIDGILFRLIDTAGIREHTHDVIESEGVQRSMQKLKDADLVIFLFDVAELKNTDYNGLSYDFTEYLGALRNKSSNFLLVANKIDAIGEEASRTKTAMLENVILISAKEKKHIEVLKERMVDTVLQGTVQSEDTVITNARHYHALKEVEKSLQDIRAGLDNKISGDLLALDIRRCLQFLGEITGEVTNDDMLDYIFSKFCIGK